MHDMDLVPISLVGIIKKEDGISRVRVNPVFWITNPNSHTPVSNNIDYFNLECFVILFNLYNRPSGIRCIIDFENFMKDLVVWQML